MGILLCTFVILLLGGESKWFQMFLNQSKCTYKRYVNVRMQKTESFLLTHTPDLLWSSLRKWKQSGARREMSGMTRPEESVVLMIMMIGDE